MNITKQASALLGSFLLCVDAEASLLARELTLSADMEVFVSSGETNEVYVLSGGAYTLSKTGGGVLKIADIASADVKIDVQAGELRVGDVPCSPGVVTNSVLHLDATDESSMTLQTDGDDTFVSTWRDANGGAHSASASKRTPPKLVRNYRNGLQVVDFGSIKNTAPSEGYGATMAFDERLNGLRETFSVMMYTEDIYAKTGQATPVFGQTGQAAFLANSMTVDTWPYFFLYTNPNTAQAQGGLYIDGESVPNATRASGEMQLVSFRLSEPAGGGTDLALADGLAFDRSFAWGGQRIGECLLFSRALTDEERAQVNSYLTTKWFPSGAWSVSQITVRSGARLTVAGTSNVAAVDISAENGDFTVAGGTVTIDPLSTREPWFHVDANVIDDSDVEDGHLLKWRDVGGNGRYASHMTSAPTWRSDPASRKPILRTSYLNGNSVVDFGSLLNDAIVDSLGVGTGYGAGMSWSATCSTVREALMIVSDTEDVATIRQTYPAAVGANALVGNVASAGNQYYRPQLTTDGTYPGVIIANNPNTSHVWGYGHGVAIDGVEVAATTSMGAGFHLLDFRSNADARAGAFACDRYLVYGGLRYGEFMVFERELGDVERARISGALMAKWLNGGGYTQECCNVSVEAGAALRMAYANLVLSGTLHVGGTIEAKSVRAAVIDATPDARIAGTLDMTVPGTVMLTSGVYGPHSIGDRFRVLQADSVSGIDRNWQAAGDIVGDAMTKIVLYAGEDGLYAELRRKPGLQILFR